MRGSARRPKLSKADTGLEHLDTARDCIVRGVIVCLTAGGLHAAEDTPGITLVRPMETFGDDDCPKGHMEILFEDASPLRQLMYIRLRIDFLSVQDVERCSEIRFSLLRKKQQHL